jgi:hypothetical protein
MLTFVYISYDKKELGVKWEILVQVIGKDITQKKPLKVTIELTFAG